MQTTHFQVGDRFFQAQIFRNGQDIDDGTGDAFATREEAEADGAAMVAGYDPEFTKRNPDAVEFVVRECKVLAIDEDGSIGASVTVD